MKHRFVMVLFLLIGSFEKVDQPTLPLPAKRISHAVHEDKTSIANRNIPNVLDNPTAFVKPKIPKTHTQRCRLMKQNIRFESLSISTIENL